MKTKLQRTTRTVAVMPETTTTRPNLAQTFERMTRVRV